MRSPIFLVIVMLAMAACSGRQNRPLREQFRWIAGQWKGQNGKVTLIERWKWNKYRYEGVGFELSGEDTLFREQLYIEDFGGQVGYVVVLPERPTRLFAPVAADSGRWVFENKEHDFPAQIIYATEGDSALTVSLLARDGAFRGEHSYQLRRAK